MNQWRYDTACRLDLLRLRRTGAYAAAARDEEFLLYHARAASLLHVQAMAASLPAGWRLVVSENAEVASARRRPLVEMLASLPNVRLADPSLPRSSLLAQARAVATHGGEIGWEALLMGKPVLTFDPAWYVVTGMAALCSGPERTGERLSEALALTSALPSSERHRRLARLAQALIDGSVRGDSESGRGSRSETYQADLATLAERIFRRYRLLRLAPRDPSDALAWSRDRTPLAAPVPSGLHIP